MEPDSKKPVEWHYETLPNETKKALDFLSKQNWLTNSDWYLAGGTALSLRVGNRKSYDLDFFTQQKSFNTNNLLAKFINNEDWQTETDEENTVYGILMGAKISFIAYPFFVPKEKPSYHGSIKVIAPLDIAVMKILAISQRGKKRDFFDLYWCVHHLDTLENIIGRLPGQYPSVAHDFQHINKSLVYFVDAETDPNPEIYFDASWGKVKRFFEKEVPLITKKLLGLN